MALASAEVKYNDLTPIAYSASKLKTIISHMHIIATSPI